MYLLLLVITFEGIYKFYTKTPFVSLKLMCLFPLGKTTRLLKSFSQDPLNFAYKVEHEVSFCPTCGCVMTSKYDKLVVKTEPLS